MAYSNTRDKIIGIARELFAKHSVYNTTMENIAKASNLGRRTLYTYFKTKDELYSAVVASEIDKLMVGLRKLVVADRTPLAKLRRYFYQRYHYIRLLIRRNPSIKNDWLFATERIEKLRIGLDKEEITLVEQILIEGNKLRAFNVSNPKTVSQLLHKALKSLEVDFIEADFSREEFHKVETLLQLTLNGIIKD